MEEYVGKKAALIDLHYLPSIEYFAFLEKFDVVLLEACENYQKQSYRNRCRIRGANKVETLSVPVQHTHSKTGVRDVRISYAGRWNKEHWRAVASAYGRAPFFEFFSEELHVLYEKKFQFLFDFNLAALTLCLRILGVQKEVKVTEKYFPAVPEGVYDARSAIHPKKSYQNNGFYKPHPYYQIFGKEFDENLSIIDLLFCEGIHANEIIKNSVAAQ